MGSVVGESQFAFIPSQQILDCSLVANEVLDHARRSGHKAIVFKIDFQKAYDTVSWDFFILVLHACGFSETWCDWIKKCVSTASISILVNGSPTEAFNITRGLRQECSLSPLLFNIVGEALNLMLPKAVSRGIFNGINVGNRDQHLEISHLQFADDLLIFCNGEEIQARNVKRVLRVFELCSGLKLNLRKSRMFGINIQEEDLNSWARKIGCRVDNFPTEYLGLPLGATRNSAHLWDPVIKNFSVKLGGWKSKFLSLGGRITLIKSILNSLPVYFISLFKMPVAIYKKFNGLISKFL
ncbi:hypothetical protein HRI_000599200 [Hibiscus trionum]|uniref:Reverse transcriptase domain-containing protein n=1 Tax=Hibiscus trionum TaxID=183268 RepID=A0A9W7H1A7_HIBTR|nr:hypothetical protein HRI_000599200 [Hibiscus trionum]